MRQRWSNPIAAMLPETISDRERQGEREGRIERERERELLFPAILPKCLQCLGLGQAEARSSGLSAGLLPGGRQSS